MDLFCTIETFWYQNQTHCTTNGFFQDGICVVWVCFVPLSMAVHIFVRNRSIRVFLCFRGVQLEAHSTFFTTKNESKFVFCATGCTPRMDLFRTIKTFFVPDWYKKSFNSTKPLRILRIL